MAKAKKIRRQTDKAAKKELKRSGALKGLSRKEKKRKIYVGGLQKRNKIREFNANEKRLRIEQAQKEADVRRDEARAKGQKLVYDVPTTPSFSSVTPNTNPSKNKGKADEARRIQKNNERIRKNQEAMRKAGGGAYKKIMQDGSVRTVVTKMKGESDADFKKRIEKAKKTRSAKHGGALAIMIAPVKSKKMKGVKAVKKGAHGAKMKEAMYGAKMKKAKMGGKLKPVPSENKGLGKLPKEVRNKMGYMKNGGKITKKQKAERAANQAKLNAEAKRLQEENLKKSKSLSVKKLKVKSSKRGEAVQAKEGIAEQLTSGPKLIKYYMSEAGGGMSREQAVAKMVRAKTGKIPSDDGKSMVKQPKMMYGGSMKKAMYGAKMKKKAMYGAKMKKKAMYGAKMKK